MNQPSPWATAFRGFDDMEDDRKRQLVTQFFHAAAPLLQRAVERGAEAQRDRAARVERAVDARVIGRQQRPGHGNPVGRAVQ